MAALHDDENDESRIERGLDICRKVLIALLVFLGMLYYVTYEYDGAFYEGSSGTAKVFINLNILVKMIKRTLLIFLLYFRSTWMSIGSVDGDRTKTRDRQLWRQTPLNCRCPTNSKSLHIICRAPT